MAEDKLLNPSKHITCLFSRTLNLCADSVEWCPNEPHHNLFVCAQYQLNDQDTGPKRWGGLSLYSITRTKPHELNLEHHIDCDRGLLDMKWLRCASPTLAVATTLNEILIYSLTECRLTLASTCKFEGEDAIILSLDCTKHLEVIASDSRGNFHWLQLDSDSLELKLVQSVDKAHDYEAWIAAFNYWDTNQCFSGGDDSRLRQYDRRLPDPIVSTKKFDSGVTAIHSNQHREHLMATGGFDSVTRLWDGRHMKSELTTIEMPGTLWRLKWHPQRGDLLLAACMDAGVHIVKLDRNGDGGISDSFYGHGSLAYGVDWCHGPLGPEGGALIASCSFYDKLLCVAEITLL